LKHSEEFADIWFADQAMSEAKEKYYDELREVLRIERSPDSLSFERERAAAKRKDLDAERKTLIADLQAQGASLREAVIKLAKPEQIAAAGAYAPPWTELDKVNALTMYGLVAMGVCLMLGLFSPLAALGGAVFLGQIYLSMPPWPGLPPNPMQEGHYLIVNKNLIEMLACLALVFIPTSFWIGFDAMLFGRMFRHREPSDVPTGSSAGTGLGSGSDRPAGVDVKPIPLSSPGVSKGSNLR